VFWHFCWDLAASFCSVCFFFSILWCSHTGDHLQEEWSKFRYRSQWKVGSFSHAAMFWRSATINYLNMMTFVIKISWFDSQKPFVWGNTHSFVEPSVSGRETLI